MANCDEGETSGWIVAVAIATIPRRIPADNASRAAGLDLQGRTGRLWWAPCLSALARLRFGRYAIGPKLRFLDAIANASSLAARSPATCEGLDSGFCECLTGVEERHTRLGKNRNQYTGFENI